MRLHPNGSDLLMTLHIYDDIAQGSEEWFAQRRGTVTASVVGKLLTATLKVANNDESRGLTATLVAERITGHTEPTWTSFDMERGVEMEPVARDIYSGHYAEAVECGFMVRELVPGVRLGYSPDGLVGDDGLIEIKSPRSKTHLKTILADAVPAHYMAQLQAGLLVSGRAWIDFVSYCGGMPLWVKRVTPDEVWHDAICEALDAFEVNAWAMEDKYRQATKDMPATERINSDLGLVF
jgi:putative phage-type endonuclease